MKRKDRGPVPRRERVRHRAVHPPFAEMVKEALKNHGGDGGLTAEDISEHIIAMNYTLVPGYENIIPQLLDSIVEKNLVARNEFGLYTLIPEQDDASLPNSSIGSGSTADEDASGKAIILLPRDTMMVQDVLVNHGGKEGLTGEAINQHIKAGGSELPPEKVQLHLDVLIQGKVITRNQSGLYALTESAREQLAGPSADKNASKKAASLSYYSWMVRDVLLSHGGKEGLTAEAINMHIKAGNYNLPAEHDDIFQDQLNVLVQKNVIVPNEAVLYTISEQADVRKLKPPVGPGHRPIKEGATARSVKKVMNLMFSRGMTSCPGWEKQQYSRPTSSTEAQASRSHNEGDNNRRGTS